MDKVLKIDKQGEGEQIILHLSGRLDTLGARQLEESLEKQIKQNYHNILLNLQDIQFLSSAGIRILIKYYKLCKEAEGDLILGNVPLQAAGVLKMVGLEQLMLPNPQAEKVIEKQERTAGNIHLECLEFHQELAEAKKQEKTPVPLQSYNMLIGRKQQNINGCGEEFITIGNRIISDEKTTDTILPQYYIGTNGSPSHFIQFKSQHSTSATIETITEQLLDISKSQCAGIICLAKSAGVVGVFSQITPEQNNKEIYLTEQPEFHDHLLLIAGVAESENSEVFKPYTRPFSPNNKLSCHYHAAVYDSVETVPTEEKDLNRILDQLLANQSLKTTLHLLNDNRPADGSGQTRLYEGVAWIIKIQ